MEPSPALSALSVFEFRPLIRKQSTPIAAGLDMEFRKCFNGGDHVEIVLKRPIRVKP
jgi:hypothetical protein